MGFRDAYAIAEHPRVEGLMLGALDLSTELRLRRRDDGDELLYARSLLAFASAAAGIRAPIDGVPASLADTASQRCQASKARDLGFGGIACVHPQQIAAINEAFAPTPDELTWATRVVAAFESATAAGRGAVAVDDELVDRPVFLRAKTLLEIASKETI
jgi:citrate lyase beta subunit